MDIGEVLTKAWKTIWNHKILWVFGILSGCMASGSGGGGGSSMQGNMQNGNWNGGPSFMSPSAQRALEDFFDTLAGIPVWVWVILALGLVVLGIILSILSLIAGSLGTAGVIKGTGMVDEDSTRKNLSFAEVFRGLKPYYWRVLLFHFGVCIAGFLIVASLIVPISLLAVCTCFVGLLLLLPVSWLITLLAHFTTIAIIEEDLGVFEAIGRAWQLIFRHLRSVALMLLILGVGQFMIGLLLLLPLLAIPIPFISLLFLSEFSGLWVLIIISVIFLLIVGPLVFLLGGILQAYVLASWTLTYRRLAAEETLEPVVLNRDAAQD